jgi:hypothetical protein
MKLKALVSLSLITLVTSLSSIAQAQTFSVVHAFTAAEGSEPQAGVTVRGNLLYGTTTTFPGTVYQLIPSGSDWLFNTIFNFQQ